MNSCMVYLSDGKEILVNGKDVYWSWFESEKTITFWATDPEDESGDDIRVAEFCRACVLAIVYVNDGSSKAEQMEDSKYRKTNKEKYYVTGRFKMELRDAIYRNGEPACVISKKLGLPSDCITKIINGYTKKMTKERHDWICVALYIDPEV